MLRAQAAIPARLVHVKLYKYKYIYICVAQYNRRRKRKKKMNINGASRVTTALVWKRGSKTAFFATAMGAWHETKGRMTRMFRHAFAQKEKKEREQTHAVKSCAMKNSNTHDPPLSKIKILLRSLLLLFVSKRRFFFFFFFSTIEISFPRFFNFFKQVFYFENSYVVTSFKKIVFASSTIISKIDRTRMLILHTWRNFIVLVNLLDGCWFPGCV